MQISSRIAVGCLRAPVSQAPRRNEFGCLSLGIANVRVVITLSSESEK